MEQPNRTHAMTQLIADYPMVLFALEAGIALLLLIGIVWWTVPGKSAAQPRNERTLMQGPRDR